MMNEATQKLCKVTELPESEGKRFIVNGEDIAVFKVGEKIHAIGNICPHQHAAAIYTGFIEDGHVYCPIHGWRFDLETGQKDSGNRGLKIYPVEIKNGHVWVTVENEEPHWKW